VLWTAVDRPGVAIEILDHERIGITNDRNFLGFLLKTPDELRVVLMCGKFPEV
jgi:hypothetical protein